MSKELRQPNHTWYVTMGWGVMTAWGSGPNHSQTYHVVTEKLDYRQAVKAVKKKCRRKSAVITSISYRGLERVP